MDFSNITDNLGFLMKGLRMTVGLSLLSIIGSLFLGTFLGVLRYSRLFPFNYLATGFIELTRSIPLILYIVFIHFTVSPYLQENSIFSSLEMQSAYIALTLFTSAYIAEIIRGGLKSIEAGCVDAAVALGLTYFQRLRYIILPLAISRMMPALISQFISLTKDTSLASAIGLIELTRSGEIIYERTHAELEILLFIALIYFIICYSLSLASKRLESKPLTLNSFKKVFQLS